MNKFIWSNYKPYVMKKSILLLGTVVFFSAFLQAQSNKEEIELFQSIWGMEKKSIVAEFIVLEGETGTAFWTLYDQYETERKAIGQKRIALIEKYAEKYLELDDVSTDELLNESIAINNQSSKLIQKYVKSIKKVAGAKVAAQFYQLENYFRSATNVALMEQMPFIGELEK